MKKRITFVGLDTHKNSIEVALADDGRNREVRLYGSIGGDIASLDKMICKLQATGGELRFVYEAGPCGYEIYRHLRAKGLHCNVVAPSMVPKRSGDRIKTDRRDACNLARLYRAGELTAIYVPREEDEAMRDLVRGRQDAIDAQRKVRQQLGGFYCATACGIPASVPGLRRTVGGWRASKCRTRPSRSCCKSISTIWRNALNEYTGSVNRWKATIDLRFSGGRTSSELK